MLTTKTITRFLMSVSANCSDGEYENIAHVVGSMPGAATAVAAADLTVKQGIRNRLERSMTAAGNKVRRISERMDAKERAIGCSQSNIRHCQERIGKSERIISRKRCELENLGSEHYSLEEEQRQKRMQLEEFDRKHPNIKETLASY